jgi:hypothetical protein
MSHLFLFLLLAQNQPTFQSGITLVRVDAEVRQDRQAVTGLGRESFRVTDNGKPQTIVYFGHQDQPLDVILLFDTRAEMRPAIERVAETAHTALSDLRPGDRAAVMAFGGNPGNCRTDLISDFTGDLGDAERSVGNQVLHREFQLRTNGCSIQGGFENAAKQFLRLPDGNRRRAIVVLTDDLGAPERSGAVRKTVRDLWKADAVVLGVIVHSGAFVFSIGPPYRGARYAASQTGGDTLNSSDAAEGLREAINRLRSRYSLYYALPPGKPSEERKIRVQLTAGAAKQYPRSTVRARTGYVTPGDSK